MSLDTVRVSQPAKEQLVRLKVERDPELERALSVGTLQVPQRVRSSGSRADYNR